MVGVIGMDRTKSGTNNDEREKEIIAYIQYIAT